MDQSAKDENPSEPPKLEWWWWLVYALVAWQFITISFWALYLPWTWTTEQFLFVGIVVLAVLWAFAWWRRGTAGIKDTLAKARRLRSDPSNKSAFRWNLIFWIAVALALVVYFNMTGHH
jgi:hypothetical protein